MKKKFVTSLVFSLLLGVSQNALAVSYVLNLGELSDLEHAAAYTWGTDWNTASDEIITDAKLTFTQIFNYNDEYHILYAHLLDEIDLGTTLNWDGQVGGDYFDGEGIELFTWENTLNKSNGPQNLTFTFDAGMLTTLNDYASAGTWGFGLDPDCHFYNDGISLEITTEKASVPEPSTMLLFGTGLVGLAGYSRRRTQKK